MKNGVKHRHYFFEGEKKCIALLLFRSLSDHNTSYQKHIFHKKKYLLTFIACVRKRLEWYLSTRFDVFEQKNRRCRSVRLKGKVTSVLSRTFLFISIYLFSLLFQYSFLLFQYNTDPRRIGLAYLFKQKKKKNFCGTILFDIDFPDNNIKKTFPMSHRIREKCKQGGFVLSVEVFGDMWCLVLFAMCGLYYSIEYISMDYLGQKIILIQWVGKRLFKKSSNLYVWPLSNPCI